MRPPKVFCGILSLLLWPAWACHCFALGQVQYIETTPSKNGFPVCETNSVATIWVDANDWPGVVRAANDLGADINRVTGKSPAISNDPGLTGKNVVIIGAIGKSELIDRLIREKKIEVSEITGKWEAFFLQVVPHPWPGIDNALVICGSDKRGTF